jgi:hypothetical protein
LAWGALVALALWAAVPLVYLLIRATIHHESLSGGDSVFAGDQLQYLAWIRGAGQHVAAANGFALRLGDRVFVHPMFLLSGLLWRTGVGIALSYLLWMPVAVAVLYVGFRQFTFRMLSSPMARSAALILALFFVTPADPLAGWTVGSSGLGTLAGQLAPSGTLYGYFPVAIAIGSSAMFMLGLVSIVDPGRRRRRLGWYLGWTSLAGIVACWLHPWQGETAILVIAGLLALQRFRRGLLPLLVPAAAAAAPLAYYFVLSRVDPAWRLAELQSAPARPDPLLLLLALAPLAVPAIVALRSCRRQDAVLWLWPTAALLVYFVSPGYAPHALEGIPLPLAVLAVRGWQRLRLPGWLAAIAISLCTLPGLAFDVHLFHDTAVSDPQALLLTRGERQALAYLARAHQPGGVLSSLRISTAVPAYTGRRTWAGHPSWTPNYAMRTAAVASLFGGRMTSLAERSFLREVGARYLLADCERDFEPASVGPLLVGGRRFGCVDVYQLAVPSRAKPL